MAGRKARALPFHNNMLFRTLFVMSPFSSASPMLHVFIVSINFPSSKLSVSSLVPDEVMGTENISTTVGEKTSSVTSACYKSWDSIADTKTISLFFLSWLVFTNTTASTDFSPTFRCVNTPSGFVKTRKLFFPVNAMFSLSNNKHQLSEILIAWSDVIV